MGASLKRDVQGATASGYGICESLEELGRLSDTAGLKVSRQAGSRGWASGRSRGGAVGRESKDPKRSTHSPAASFPSHARVYVCWHVAPGLHFEPWRSGFACRLTSLTQVYRLAATPPLPGGRQHVPDPGDTQQRNLHW